MTPTILFRKSLAEEDELDIARQYFNVVEYRSRVPPNSLVIPRYSLLPYHRELAVDVAYSNGALINTPRQHEYIANLREWYQDLESVTPKTWFRLEDVPRGGGPFVLKGGTNSKKFQWKTHMYAENFEEAVDVHTRLMRDGLIGDQDIVIRQYVPLKYLDTGVQGLPISEEYRFFVLDDEIVGRGFYWSSHSEDFPELSPEAVPEGFLKSAIDMVAGRSRFYVIDVARTEEGDWIVVELNDGCMSSLSDIDPHDLYSNMASVLRGEAHWAI